MNHGSVCCELVQRHCAVEVRCVVRERACRRERDLLSNQRVVLKRERRQKQRSEQCRGVTLHPSVLCLTLQLHPSVLKPRFHLMFKKTGIEDYCQNGSRAKDLETRSDKHTLASISARASTICVDVGA